MNYYEKLFNVILESSFQSLNEGSTGEKRVLRVMKSKKRSKRAGSWKEDNEEVDRLSNKNLNKKVLRDTGEKFGDMGEKFRSKVASGSRKGFMSHLK
jgi:hypothetical protein